jgi:vacuolar-type H+-ATPase subunit I/STV1
MSQSTLDDDELFGEAASEMREDVEASLAEARSVLPAADDIWDVEADNTLGVLNALKDALDVEDAEAHLRDAKKWYTMGERADAFEDADDLEAAIEEIEELIEDVEEAREQVSDLTATIPQLRGTLEEFAEADEESENDADADTDADADAEAEA